MSEIIFHNGNVGGDINFTVAPVIKANTATDNVNLFGTTTTGTIYLGDGLSTGHVYIGRTQTTGNVYVTNNTGNLVVLSGKIRLTGIPNIDCVTPGSNASLYSTAGLISIGTGSTGNVNVGSFSVGNAFKINHDILEFTSPPKMRATNLGDTVSLFGTTTTGSINIGTSLTSGNVTIGNESGTNKLIVNQTQTEFTAPPKLVAGTVSDAISLFDNTTSGTLTMANAMTTGNVTIGANMTTGSFNLGRTLQSGTFRVNTAGVVFVSTSFSMTHNNATTAIPLFGTTTTGSITLGNGLTTGNINLGNSSQTGIVDVKSELRLSNKGTVTQITDITTAVTLSKPIGIITTVSSTLGADTSATFSVTNTYCDATSVVVANVVDYGGTGYPVVNIDNVAAGSFDIIIRNVDASNALNDVIKICFVIL